MMRRIAVTAATDPAKLRALAAALDRTQVDEWRWWLVFGEREQEVLALAAELGVEVDSFPGPAGCAARYHRLCVSDSTVYVRLDEGVTWLAPDFFEAMQTAATAPDVILAHANVATDEVVQAEVARGAADSTDSLTLGMQAYAWQGRHFAKFGGYATAEPRSLLRDAASGIKMRPVIATAARCSVGGQSQPLPAPELVAASETVPPEAAPELAPPQPAPQPAEVSVVAETVPAEAEDAHSSTAPMLVEAPPAPRKRRVTRRNVVVNTA